MRGWIIALAGAAFLAVAASALVVAVVVSSGGATSIVDLEVGSCFDLSPADIDDGTLETVDVIDCSQPHLAEVVAIGDLNPDSAPYPDEADLFAEVDRACRSATTVDDEFGLLPIAPTAELWESFEGRFLCLAIPFGGRPVTGTATSG